MTEAVLVSVITLLCGGSTFNTGTAGEQTIKIAEQLRIDCYEKYVNCSVKSDGKIMELKEFQNKCVKK